MKPAAASALSSGIRAVMRLFRRPRRNDLVIILGMVGIVLLIALTAMALMFLMGGTAQAAPLSAGDRVQVLMENGDGFSGKYQVDVQGQILLPYAGPVPVGGLEPEQAAQAVTQRLESTGFFRPGAGRSTVQVLWWAPLNVHVSGEVFNPGVHVVNMPASRDRSIERAEEIPGAYLPNRNLSDALKAAGGITPWSDIARVVLRRRGVSAQHDVRHLLSGTPGSDPALQEGDEVIVERLEHANANQVRPSAITPPGIKVFAGNMVQSQNNASAANAMGALPLAYGSRFSQAVVAINCAGGVWSNTSRMASLLRTQRLTGKTLRWNVSVERLLDDGSDDINPLLQEGDALACYDSVTTGWREVFRVLTEVLTPMSLWRGLP
jgi:polysaccharide export outer membrane protein